MKTAGTVLLWAAGGLVLAYLAALVAIYAAQRRILYPAPQGAAAAPPPGAGFHVVGLKTSDGLSLRAFYRAARPGQPTLIFFHGNGDSLRGSETATALLAAQGYGVLLPEYRGYGGNAGSPSEAGFYRDGAAALGWLTAAGIRPERIVAIGNSMGSGVATELAHRHRLGGLVLVSAFVSLPAVVTAHLPYVPAAIVRDRYENAAKLASVRCPVLILHGTADTIVPAANGRALAAALPAASFQLVEGVGHELAYLPPTQTRIADWLAARLAKPAQTGDEGRRGD